MKLGFVKLCGKPPLFACELVMIVFCRIWFQGSFFQIKSGTLLAQLDVWIYMDVDWFLCYNCWKIWVPRPSASLRMFNPVTYLFYLQHCVLSDSRIFMTVTGFFFSALRSWSFNSLIFTSQLKLHPTANTQLWSCHPPSCILSINQLVSLYNASRRHSASTGGANANQNNNNVQLVQKMHWLKTSQICVEKFLAFFSFFVCLCPLIFHTID